MITIRANLIIQMPRYWWKVCSELNNYHLRRTILGACRCTCSKIYLTLIPDPAPVMSNEKFTSLVTSC